MTLQEQKELIRQYCMKLAGQYKASLFDFQQELEKLLTSKGNDYSNEDRLSNFKEVGELIGTDPRQVCVQMIAVKISRISNLIKSGNTPNNESLSDSIDDLNGYSLLLKMIDLEIQSNEP